MADELSSELFLRQIEKGSVAPYYLLFGPNQFLLERALHRALEILVPEESRDFNYRLYYGEKGGAPAVGEVLDAARTLPFFNTRRLIVVRRVENLPASSLEGFLEYLDDPSEANCLIFVASKPNFTQKFYKKIKQLGRAIEFRNLTERQVVLWIQVTAKELGMRLDLSACEGMKEMVGTSLMALYSELEKLAIRHGDRPISIEQVKESALSQRLHTMFELMDTLSVKKVPEALSMMRNLLEVDREAPLKIVGMVNRQMRLLWHTKTLLQDHRQGKEIAQHLGIAPFLVERLTRQSEHWDSQELEQGFHLLYRIDGLLKSGSNEALALENALMNLCLKPVVQRAGD